ncbi:MAG: adenosylmethionine--8-amino-7-oxononanoate transaminase [Hyphomicrobiaceae bacterium]|nr:adenosylmethionine--8-amino-7-oxononanoate transaminase [Hyphomicrobiaceae bacterium]
MTGNSTSPVWHPFTQHATAPAPIKVAHAEGARLWTTDHDIIIDAISSWWVVTHGHGHRKIMAAIKDQADRLDQVIFAGFTHEPAEALARELIELVPPGLTRVFYSDSGSTAVEVALKMALGTFHNRGEKRTRILSLEHGYHGDTIGTMAAGARGVFNAAYAPLLYDVTRIPFPVAGQEQTTFDAIDAACRTGDVAAMIVEPLILGAGGMLMYAPTALAEMARIVRHYGALFIADEVMTGWGRTGTLFASEQAGPVPDLLCLAKGLTGGAIPLAATLATEEIFDAHFSEDRSKTFFHSSSYTANPIACAAALANVKVWRQEPVLARIKTLTEMQRRRLAALGTDNRFRNIRQLGTIAALDIDVPDGGYLARIGPALQRHALSMGVLLRPLGNTVYVMPPYCISSDDLDQVYRAIVAGEAFARAGAAS